jgi:hypothetical protein
MVQSNCFSKLNRRVVIPLVVLKPSAREFDEVLMPSFTVENREVFLMTADLLNRGFEARRNRGQSLRKPGPD